MGIRKMVKYRKEDESISKTQQWNAIVMALATLVGVLPELRTAIGPEYYPWIFVGVKVVDTYLRNITTGPVT